MQDSSAGLPHTASCSAKSDARSVNGITTTITSALPAGGLGTVLGPRWAPLLVWEAVGWPGARALPRSSSPPYTCCTFTVYTSLHNHLLLLLILKHYLQNAKMMSLCSWTFKGKPTVSQFQHNLLYLFLDLAHLVQCPLMDNERLLIFYFKISELAGP